jgi:hypothetical protein
VDEILALRISYVEIVMVSGDQIHVPALQCFDRLLAHQLRGGIYVQTVFLPYTALTRDDPEGRMRIRTVNDSQVCVCHWLSPPNDVVLMIVHITLRA